VDVMKQNKYLKILLLCLFLSISILIQTACSNINIAASSLAINNSNLSEKNGQTVNAPVEKEEDIIALEKEQKVINQKEKAAKLLEIETKRTELENEIKAYLGNNVDNVGLSFHDINSGKEIIINGDKTFLAASTVKVQMNMVLGDMVQSGAVSENESLSYTKDSYEEGTGILQAQDLTNPFSISLLSDYSIIHSDNIATNMIIKRIDYYKMRELIDDKLGHTTDNSDNYITANDETKLLELLFSNSSNNPVYIKIIENMKNTDFHDRLDLYLPHNIVAHKVGDFSSYVNDVGIIYTENPYILSIYTNGIDNANEVIAHISKMIYDYQNSVQT
jgi:beta-lactamase class A